ncbi:MAG: M28 family peptidase [Phycisphaerae bacterium]|nr:M28 family peptidase [Phycisphaerae bacterium]
MFSTVACLACAIALRAVHAADAARGGAAPSPEHLVRALNAVPTPASLAAFHELLGSEPHIAGTEGDARAVQRLRDAFVEMGLTTVVEEFWAPLPQPQHALLEIVQAGVAGPSERRGVIPLSIVERNLLEDPATLHPGLTYGWNAYSGNGDVTAEVVYANYGTKADFAKLAAQGTSVQGKMVLARYGGNFRGYKWKFAEEAGAVGLLIFTDPADSGDVRGPTYPEGGWANDTCVQRGSILALEYPGDPQTPFAASTETVARTDLATLALPRIPVQPIGYAAAAQIMVRMKGDVVAPDSGWKGGMPVDYRVVGGPDLQVRLSVQQDRAVRRTANVIAMVPGRVNPDQLVIIGCHHDAWGFGAADPLAGTIVLMECAKSFAAAAKRGEYPDRTVVFAAWGAEEYGIIGSTEWVEGHRDWLSKGAVAYINLDMAAMGPNFGASCSPSLREAILSACVRVPQAGGAEGETVYDRVTGGGRTEPKFGDLGGGSDHIAFNCHTGIASMSFGGGGSQGSSYHSNYDTIAWYRKVVGADYQPALMITRMTNAVACLLADSPVVPLSAARHGRDTVRVLQALRARAQDAQIVAAIDSLLPRAAELAENGAQLDAAIASAIPTLDGARRRAVSDALISLDRAWIDQAGLEGRPWFRSLLAASDRDSGYASIMLPLMTEAVAAKNAAQAAAAASRYALVFERLAQGMNAALQSVRSARAEDTVARVSSPR